MSVRKSCTFFSLQHCNCDVNINSGVSQHFKGGQLRGSLFIILSFPLHSKLYCHHIISYLFMGHATTLTKVPTSYNFGTNMVCCQSVAPQNLFNTVFPFPCRGIAVEDPTSPGKIRLLMKDYPYAVDGLKIWSSIETWVSEYCSIYYPSDTAVKSDAELQAWWKEVREVGHGDKKDEPWWPKMQTVPDLIQSCTTIIWVASALHAAVNFGQYPYAGYLPNRPTLSRKFMPEPGSDDHKRLENEAEKVFLETITRELQCIIEISLIEILSTHSSDEIYLGQRETQEWTKDQKALDAFERFGAKLREIEAKITEMNQDPSLLNRNGPVKVPYNLLFPTSGPGLTAKGIPNSVSI